MKCRVQHSKEPVTSLFTLIRCLCTYVEGWSMVMVPTSSFISREVMAPVPRALQKEETISPNAFWGILRLSLLLPDYLPSFSTATLQCLRTSQSPLQNSKTSISESHWFKKPIKIIPFCFPCQWLWGSIFFVRSPVNSSLFHLSSCSGLPPLHRTCYPFLPKITSL